MLYQPLGGLSHVRVWHDSSGNSPGWFLRQIVVTNRGTGETSFFLCNRWLAADEDDGKIHRVLLAAEPDQLTKFRNLFLSKSARDMNDDHVWFSVLGRPARSPFTRVQRLSCCLTLLYSTMLTNIMFFGRGDDFDPPAPIRFAGLLMISIQSAAIILPVNLLIVFLFRHANSAANPEGEKGKKTKPAAAWFLIWATSFVPAYFTVLYTLSFGRAKAEAWLVTFLTTFLTDLFVMQPTKLLGVAVMFALLVKPPYPFQMKQKPVEDEDPPASPLQGDEEYLQTNAGNLNQSVTATEWTHYFRQGRSGDYSPNNNKNSSEDREPAAIETLLAEQRESRKRRNFVLQVLLFGLFVTVVMAMSYVERSPMAYHMSQHVQNLILDGGEVSFSEVEDISSFWTWITISLIPVTYGATVDSVADNQENVLRFSYPVGPVQLRNVRLKPDVECKIPTRMMTVSSRCTVAYSDSAADTHNYTQGWIPDNTTANGTEETIICSKIMVLPNATRTPDYRHCVGKLRDGQDVWKYTFVSFANGFPYVGQHGTYRGGGYIASLGTTNQSSLNMAAYLQQHNWLDSQTRAVIVDGTLYNPHVNLFSLLSTVVEFTTLGAVHTSSEVITLRLMQRDAILLLVLRLFMALFLMHSAVKEGENF
ncbi:polycystin-1-like protein 2 [Branchiostoma floridae x Branchiostoma japonicum]